MRIQTKASTMCPSSGFGVKRGSGLMRSETNGLRAQTTTSPLGCVRYAILESSPEHTERKKKHAQQSRVCCSLKEHSLLSPWPCRGGARCWWGSLCGCVLGELVSESDKKLKLDKVDAVMLSCRLTGCEEGGCDVTW